jgi:RHS repeat-associated protein
MAKVHMRIDAKQRRCGGAEGNRLSKTAVQVGSPNPVSVLSQYSYDAIYELTQAVVNGSVAESYTYDAVGNRLTSAGPTSYNYNASNELTSSSVAIYAYDNNGNTTSKTTSAGTTSYTWDFENRLSSVRLPGTGGTVNFQYDPFGRRIYKSSPAGTYIYVYDGSNVIQELGGAGNLLASYTQGPGIDQPLALYSGPATSYFQADGLGSITSLTNSAGAVAASYVYDSFGNLTASTGTATNPVQYTGRECDPETGLYYYRARYFDPAQGRFMSEDPIRLQGGINFYPYVKNSAPNLLDPSGEIFAVNGMFESSIDSSGAVVNNWQGSAWMTALAYLDASPAAESIISYLWNSSTVYEITVSATIGVDQLYGPYKADWNPQEALCVKNGVQSPALQLLHELIHLWQYAHGWPLKPTVDPAMEEQAVQMSNTVAAQLGEPSRINYSDEAGSSTWLQPVPTSSQEECQCQNPKR